METNGRALLLASLLIVSALGACAGGHQPPTPAGTVTSGRQQEDLTAPPTIAMLSAEDPLKTDPDHYTVIMENERVRVLRYHDEPGEKTHMHRHPDAVVYALSSFTRKLSFPDGSERTREFKDGDVMWIPAQAHVGENIGTTATEVLLVEMKRTE